MDSDERDIFNFLQTWGSEYVGVKEICRRAGTKKRFHEDADWARPVLQKMLENGILERDEAGRYRVKPKDRKHRGGRWVSPDIANILKENGLETDHHSVPIPIEDPEPT
jgi:hypothetical protein